MKLPNMPPVSIEEVIKYLAWGYANAQPLGTSFGKSAAEDPDSELSKHYRAVGLRYSQDAALYRQILQDIRLGNVQGCIQGGKVNAP